MKRILSILIIGMLLVSGLAMVASSDSRDAQTAFSQPVTSAPTYKTQNPIRINNNSDFLNEVAYQGWNGSGNASDPYIIENYAINGTGYGYCLYIGNTTVNFIVRNSYFNNASGKNSIPYYPDGGLVLYNVTNASVYGNIMENCDNYGIYMRESTGNIVDHNTMSDNTGDIVLYEASNNTISNNMVGHGSGTSIGLYVSCSNNTVAWNTVLYAGNVGIACTYSSNNNTIVGNTVAHSTYYGIVFDHYSSGSLVYHNNILYNGDWQHPNGFENDNSHNRWNLSYPGGGNHWSDYTGSDAYHGPGQNISGSDGIGDTEYSNAVTDSYPIMKYIRKPIRINNDTEFDSEHGVSSGDGSPGNPYVISNYDIDGEGYGYCIYIGNTTKNFIVSDVVVHNASGVNTFPYFPDTGIVVFNATAGEVYNTLGRNNNNYAVYVRNSTGIYVHGNTAYENNYGLVLYGASNNTFSDNTVRNNHRDGITAVISSNNNTITGNDAYSNSGSGISILVDSRYNDVTDNHAYSNSNDGIVIDRAGWNNVTGNNASFNGQYGVVSRCSSPSYDAVSDHNNISDNTIWYNNRGGISLGQYSDYDTALNNTVYENWRNGAWGIYIGASHDIIRENRLFHTSLYIYAHDKNVAVSHTLDTSNTVNGRPVYYWKDRTGGAVPEGAGEVILANCNGVLVRNQTLTDEYAGVYILYSGNNTVENSTIEASYGIHMSGSGGRNRFMGNNISNSTVGISSEFSTYLGKDPDEVVGNYFSENGWGVGLGLSAYYINITDNIFINTWDAAIYSFNGVNINATGNTIINWKDTNNGIWLDNTNFCNIYNNSIENHGKGNGVYVRGQNHFNISGNTIKTNQAYYGISFQNYGSAYLSLENNSVTGNDSTQYGIFVSAYDGSKISNNSIYHNADYGLYVNNGGIGGNNEIYGNTIAYNDQYGLYLQTSSGNNIYHNSFIHNGIQAYDDTGSNVWNATYPTGGNYWSDYNGADYYSGPSQNIPGTDGIGDVPYISISGAGGTDNYPLVFPPGSAPTYLATGGWPMFHHDVFHTGIGDFNGSQGAWEYWNFSTGGEVRSSPAIAEDGTVYFGSYDGTFYALYPNGTEKWAYHPDASPVIASSPAIADDGTVYFGARDNYLYALNPNGTLKWKIELNGMVDSSPVVASDGTVYAGTLSNRLYAIHPDGVEKWNVSVNAAVVSSPVINSTGTVFFSTFKNQTYAVNPYGTILWNRSIGANITSSPTLAGDDAVLICGMDGALYGLSQSDGSIIGMINISATSGIEDTVAFNPDNSMFYIGDDDGVMHALNVSSDQPSFEWNFTTGGAIVSSPAVGQDGTIYFGSADGNIYALNPDGTEKWHMAIGANIRSSPAIADGLIYVGSASGRMYAIGDVLPPMLSIDSPAAGSLVTGNVTVSWTGSDSGSGISYYQYRITPGQPAWASAGASTSHTFTNLTSGTYTVEIGATDYAGHTTIRSVTFDVDAVPPEIVSGTPEDGNTGVPLNQPIVLNFSESIDISTFAYSCSPDPGGWSVSWSNNNTTATLTHADFQNFVTYTFTVSEAKDLAGNSLAGAPAGVSFTTEKENEPPSSFIEPLSKYWQHTQTTLTLNATDNSGLKNITLHYRYSEDNSSWSDWVQFGDAIKLSGTSNSTDVVFTFPNGEGYYQFMSVATDMSGNAEAKTTADILCGYDITTPTVEITSPGADALLSSSSVTVQWSGSDEWSGVAYYLVRIDKVMWINVGTDTEHTFTGLEDGEHLVEVRATDRVGFLNITNSTFTIDTTPPEVTSHTPDGTSVPVNTAITVTFSEPMNKSSVSISIVGVSGTLSWAGDTAVFTLAENLAENTTYSVTVTGNDPAGNALIPYSWRFTTVSEDGFDNNTGNNTSETGTLTGTVKDSDGNAVADATVTVVGTDKTSSTDDNGDFAIENIPEGAYEIIVEADGYNTTTLHITITPGNSTTVTPILSPAPPSPSSSSQTQSSFPWWVLLLIVLVALALLVLVMKMRKKPPVEEKSTGEDMDQHENLEDMGSEMSESDSHTPEEPLEHEDAADMS